MKIIQFVADGNAGGGTTVVLSICKQLQEMNNSILLVSQDKSYLEEKSIENGITFRGLNFKYRFNLITLIRLRRIITLYNPDAIHVHGARAGIYFLFLKNKFIYTVHGYHFLKKSIYTKYFAKFIEILLSLRSAVTTFVSDGDKKIALSNNIININSNIRVIKNGIDFSILKYNSKKTNEKIIGFLGRLSYQKNPLFFLEVINELCKKHEYRAFLIGGGELDKPVNEYIDHNELSNYITRTGAIDHKTAIHLLEKCSLLVMPSLWEGLPITLLESMYLGIPVVASNIPGIKEIIKNNENGILVEKYNVNSYHEAIKILENPEIYSKLSLNAHHLIESKFKLSVMIDSYYKEYLTMKESSKEKQ